MSMKLAYFMNMDGILKRVVDTVHGHGPWPMAHDLLATL